MIKRKINDDFSLDVPQGYNELTVKQFIQIQAILKKPDVSSLRNILDLVSIVTHSNPSTIASISYNLLIAIYSEILEWLGKTPNSCDVSTMVIGDKTYKLRSIEDFSTKEFIDFDVLAGGGVDDNIPLLLALAYYDGDKSDSYKDDIIAFSEEINNSLNAEFAYNAITSFSTSLLHYVYNILGSSEQAMKMIEKNPDLKMKMMTIKNLVDGAGN